MQEYNKLLDKNIQRRRGLVVKTADIAAEGRKFKSSV